MSMSNCSCTQINNVPFSSCSIFVDSIYQCACVLLDALQCDLCIQNAFEMMKAFSIDALNRIAVSFGFDLPFV